MQGACMSATPPATTPAPTKSFLLSKTIWLQILMFALGFYPPALAWVKANPESALGVITALNVLMRFATSGKVSILPPEDVENKGGTSGMVSLLAMGVAVGLLGVSLPSCSAGQIAAARAIPITVCGSYQGAKVCVESGGQKPDPSK